MSQVISIRLPDNLAKLLAEVAKDTERPKSFHIQKALETYIQEYADLQIALDRLNDPGDEVISSKEMRELLGL